jgi:hypothetical protein
MNNGAAVIPGAKIKIKIYNSVELIEDTLNANKRVCCHVRFMGDELFIN